MMRHFPRPARPVVRTATRALATLFLVAGSIATACAHPEKAAPVPRTDAKPAAATSLSAPYFLTTDAATGQPLPAPARQVVKVWKGREFRFASEANWKTFEAAPDKFVGKVDKAMIEAQRPLYPTKDCLVSDEALGSMGEPIDVIVANRLVRLCCKSCDDKLAKNEATVLKALDAAAIKAQKAAYPLKTCVVSGQPLGTMGDPVDMVIGGRLVRLCCSSCVSKLEADPAGYAAKVTGGKKS